MNKLSFLLILLLSACSPFVTVTPTVTSTVGVTPQPFTKTAEPSQAPDLAEVLAVGLYVRAERSNGSAAVGSLQLGDVVEILDDCPSGWCQISDPAGYVWKGCLTINDGLRCEAKP